MPILDLIADPTPSYLTIAQADDLAETVPQDMVSAFVAATDADKSRALKQASYDVDSAMRYQGRKYDLTTPQVLEFPRIPYPTSLSNDSLLISPTALPQGQVWEWDVATNTAVVPERVKLATLYQAASLLDGKRKKRLDARHDGVQSHSAGQLSETFQSGGEGVSKLVRAAFDLVEIYVLRSGNLV